MFFVVSTGSAWAANAPPNCTTVTGTFKNGYEYGYESACVYGASSHWQPVGKPNKKGQYRRCGITFDDLNGSKSGSKGSGPSGYNSGYVLANSDPNAVCRQMGFREMLDYETQPKISHVTGNHAYSEQEVIEDLNKNPELFVRVGSLFISKPKVRPGKLMTKITDPVTSYDIKYPDVLSSVTCFGFIDSRSDEAQREIDELQYYDWSCKRY